MSAVPLGKAINATLASLLESRPEVVLLGEDVGRLGGVFRITTGLQERFGPERVRDAVLAEASIIGQAVGMSMAGLVPICEIQFDGFLYPGLNQLATQAARMRDRWSGRFTPSMLVRVPSGGGGRGVEHHSESSEGLFAQVPGLAVAYPSSAGDYAQMIPHALTLGQPVMVHEPLRLYWRRPTTQLEAPEGDPMAARLLRPGTHLTVVTYGALVPTVLAAAEAVSGTVDVEVLDLRWVVPLDLASVLASVERTGALLVVHEGPRAFGVGAELAAEVSAALHDRLRAPVARLAPARVGYPPADREHEYLVNESAIIRAMQETAACALT